MIINSTSIVQMCSKLGALSSNQAGLQSADFLNLANMVMGTLTSELLSAREEFLIYQDSIPVVAGQAAYRVPYRAINGDLRHLWFESGDGTRQRLWGKQPEQIEDYSTTATGTPDAFFMQGNSIILLPVPQTNGNLLVSYPFRPNLLVDSTTCQTIYGIYQNQVSVANIPTGFLSGGTFDIIDHTSGNGIIYYDQVATISGTTLTFNQSLPLASVGNYVAVSGQSPVPMIPEEGHPLLLETTIMRLEMIRGDTARVKNSAQLVADARKSWDMLLSHRVTSKAHAAGSGSPQFPMRPF